jgi:hypothetical protein
MKERRIHIKSQAKPSMQTLGLKEKQCSHGYKHAVSPMDKHSAAIQTSFVNEIVGLGEILSKFLTGVITGIYAQVHFVLQRVSNAVSRKHMQNFSTTKQFPQNHHLRRHS